MFKFESRPIKVPAYTLSPYRSGFAIVPKGVTVSHHIALNFNENYYVCVIFHAV